MKPPAFQFYADDFIAGTCDLSTSDVGAYIRLLCYQWNRGSIPVDDPARLERIAGALVSPDVLSKFPRGKNTRMESVRKKQNDYRHHQSLKGLASAKARFNRGSTELKPAVQPKGNSPSPSPTPNNTLLTASAVSSRAAFEEIWKAYPRKVGKIKAARIITGLLSKNPPEYAGELLAKVKLYAETVRNWPAGDAQYVPHPSTWFTRGSYDDDPSAWVRTATNQKQIPPQLNRTGWTS